MLTQTAMNTADVLQLVRDFWTTVYQAVNGQVEVPAGGHETIFCG